ncbi:MAG: VCBS repeat-containing protein [Proteobacteria bacterium]|nr:VCBS repeat-containing protein [Pseudomonadota bacterium]
MFLLLVGCFDYTFFDPGDIRPPSGMHDAGIPRVAVPDPFSACDNWELTLASDVNIDETCIHEQVFGELDAMVEWQVDKWESYPAYTDVVMAPAVGQLTDDDGDGTITFHDTPDIVLISEDPRATADNGNALGGALRVLNGTTGKPSFSTIVYLEGETQAIPYRYSNVALADVNRDGLPEITLTAMVFGPPVQDTSPPDSVPPEEGDSGDTEVPIDPGPPLEDGEPANQSASCSVIAVTPSGELVWTNDAAIPCGGHAPAVGDLEGDGDIEVVFGNLIIEGRTGVTIAKGTSGEAKADGNAEFGTHPVLSDLDMDGVQEILAGDTLYDPSGSVICRTGTDDGYPAPADLDMDGVGEFVLVAGGSIGLYEADCTNNWSKPLNGGGHGGPPTIADFDADGVPEIGVAEAETYTVYETDGTVLWSTAVTDASSHTTGSVVFDFEGDGRPEVVYADETALWVFAGHDGTVRLMDELHESRTLHEFPTVVDVDGDGQTEILVPNAGTHYSDIGLGGLYALGSKSGSWLGNRQVWNQHGYCISNIDDDLSVPSPATSNWPTHNNFRSGDPNPVGGGKSADIVVQAEACDLECEVDQATVVVRLGNGGLAGLPAWIPVALTDSEGQVLKVSFSAGVIPPGEVGENIVFRLTPDEVPADNIVIVVADRNNTGAEVVRECHEDNNTATVTLPCAE